MGLQSVADDGIFPECRSSLAKATKCCFVEYYGDISCPLHLCKGYTS